MKRPQSDSDPQHAGLDLDRLIACPGCDAVYTAPRVEQHERAYCARCHHVLIAPRRKAGKQLIALALTVLIPSIAWEAHLGGAVTGLMMGAFTGHRATRRR